jgi:hypothetical protein
MVVVMRSMVSMSTESTLEVDLFWISLNTIGYQIVWSIEYRRERSNITSKETETVFSFIARRDGYRFLIANSTCVKYPNCHHSQRCNKRFHLFP